jgi:hypothetical protein
MNIESPRSLARPSPLNKPTLSIGSLHFVYFIDVEMATKASFFCIADEQSLR